MAKRKEAPLALEAFCLREYPRVFGALALYTGESALAEELTQETFERVCRDWSKVARLERPGAWAHRVAMNLAKSRFRRRAAGRRAEARVKAGTVSAVASSTNDEIAVRGAVAGLPDDERAVIVLRYFADLSVADTAAALGTPEGTIKTRSRRALERLAVDGFLVDDADPLMEVGS